MKKYLGLLLFFPVILLACTSSGLAPSQTTQPALPEGTSTGPEPAEKPGPAEAMIPRITVEELKAKYDRQDDMLIADARSTEEYASEHIPGAVSAPLADIVAGNCVPPEDKAKEIIFYCT